MTREWFAATELAGMVLMPTTPQNVSSRAKREGWKSRPRKARGGGKEYHISSLPLETQAACLVGSSPDAPVSSGNPAILYEAANLVPGLSFSESLSQGSEEVPFSYDRDSLWDNHGSKTFKQKEAAQEKLRLLNAVMTMVDNGTGIVDAFKAVGKAHGKSWRTIQGWYHGTSGKPGVKHYDRCDWAAALIPGYIGRTATTEINEEAWEIFKADYLRLEKPAASACYNRLKRIANDRGWQLPSRKTLERRIQQIPRTIRVLMRDGEHALMRMYPAQQRSVLDMHALEWISGDGYQHNVFVLWPDGAIERPKTWVWQDVYSRKILAYRVDVTENTDVIRLSFGDLVETYGIPQHVVIDNTRGAANKWMTGGVKNRYRFKIKEDDPLGLIPSLCGRDAVHWTSVLNGKGHGQAKPVERAFGVGGISEVVDRHPAFTGAYTGHNTTAKPENYGSKAIPIETFLQVLQEEIIAWNALAERRTEICNGVLSFDEAFNASYTNAPISKATAEQRRLWLLSAEAIKVRHDGTVTLDAGSAVGKGRNRYYAHDLLDYQGHKVVLRFDPEELHGSVYAYTLDGRYICECKCIEATGFGNTEAARSFNKLRKRFMKAAKVQAKATTSMNAIEVADRLPTVAEPEIPNPKVVRPLRAEPKLGRPVPLPTLSEEDQAEVAAFQAEFGQQPAQIFEAGDDPQSRYRRWSNLDRRLDDGQHISTEDMKFWKQYQKGAEFALMKEMFTDFNLEAEA